MLRDRFGVSQRRACRVVGQHRSTQRLDPPVPSDDEIELRGFLRAFSKERPRWEWRRAAKAARRAGWKVNDKRIQRLWREEGLKVPYRKRKKPHRGIGTAVRAERAELLDLDVDRLARAVADIADGEAGDPVKAIQARQAGPGQHGMHGRWSEAELVADPMRTPPMSGPDRDNRSCDLIGGDRRRPMGPT